MRRFTGILPLLLLAGCAAPTVPARAVAIPSPSPSPSPSPTPSPVRTAAPATTSPKPESPPPACRYATKAEVGRAVGQPVTGWLEAVGGCWYLIGTVPGLLTSVKITVFRNRVAQQDQGEVAVPGLGGKAWWYDGHNLEVQVGRDVVWVDTGDITAEEKLAPAKVLFSVVRKRL